MKTKVIKFFGYLLTALSFYYIYITLNKSEIKWNVLIQLLDRENIFLMFFSLSLYLLVLYISSAYWSSLLQSFSQQKKRNKLELMAVYAKSNLGKYLPGNFMQFVGRNILGNQLGYKHSNILLSTLFDMIYVVISGVFLLLLMIVLNLSTISLLNAQLIPKEMYFIVAYTVIPIILVLSLLYRDYITKFIQKNQIVLRVKNTILGGVSLYVIVFLLLGLANLLLMCLFPYGFTMSNYFNILFVFIISWIIGFIVPGSPGGIGIREAVFIFLLSQSYQLLVVTLIPIIFRIISIFGDVVFFGLSLRRTKQM